MTTITLALIEQVARRIRQLQDYRPGGGSDLEPVDAGSLHDARDAIAAHIALAEIMPPDRATLLAVTDAAGDVGSQAARTALAYEDPYAPEASAWDRHAQLWIEFSETLRAKAGGGE